MTSVSLKNHRTSASTRAAVRRTALSLAQLVATLLCCAISGSVVAAPRAQLTPGGIAILPLGDFDSRPSVTYGDKRVLTVQHEDGWHAYVGIALSAKQGAHSVRVNGGDVQFTVNGKTYLEQRLTITNTRKVDPLEQDLERIRSERTRKANARLHWSDELLGFDFIRPVTGPKSSSYGLRRILNGQPRNPHSGMDIAAPTGTPILAPAAGRVIEVGDFFFSGNMVYIDHGQGLISLYAHMSKMDVAVGDTVDQGQKLGEVGETGRVTGPHLHWSVGLNGNWIDPALFLDAP